MSKLDDEVARLMALKRYELLDTAPEVEFDQLADLARSIFAVPMAGIALVDENRQWFKSRRGFDAAQFPRQLGLCEEAIRSNAVMLVGDTHQDERFAHSPLVTGGPMVRSYMGAPLTTPDGYNIGTICVMDTLPRDFSSIDREVLANIARVIVTQMELRMIVSEDQQTGATSRRAFMNLLTKELERHKRNFQPSSLLILDLDNFRAINDSHGHPIGDAVLRVTAQTVFRSIRRGDVLGRIGGEEFGIFLSAAGASEGMEAAERIRQAIETALVPDRPELRFTASVGVVACCEEFGAASDWLAAARALVKEAKSGGRNRTVAAMGRVNAVAQVPASRILH